jgi:hypothetical protein
VLPWLEHGRERARIGPRTQLWEIAMLRAVMWIVGIIFLIGLLVVFGVLDFIF